MLQGKMFLFIALAGLSFVATAQNTIELNIEGKKCQASFQPNQFKTSRGSLLLIASQDSLLLNALQRSLAQYGWSSLRLLMNKHCRLNQLPEAIRYLRKQQNKRSLVLYYGKRLNDFLQYFQKDKRKQLNGLVLLSAYDIPSDTRKSVAMTEMKLPIFDVVGQFDYDSVRRQWQARKQQMHGQKHYYPLELLGADHEYAESRQALTNWLVGWMKKQIIPEVAPSPF